MTGPRVEINGETVDTTWQVSRDEGWRPSLSNTAPIEGPMLINDGDHIAIILEDGERHEGTVRINMPEGEPELEPGALSLTFTPDESIVD